MILVKMLAGYSNVPHSLLITALRSVTFSTLSLLASKFSPNVKILNDMCISLAVARIITVMVIHTTASAAIEWS